ncbi:MAG: hypothetical protein ACREMG_00240, partial [Gemmatimonadales bacterium]
YQHLCECFRRQPGKLSLTEREFAAARGEYVRHVLRAWNERQFALAVADRPAPPPRRPTSPQHKPHRRRKPYLRRTRQSALDHVPGDWRLAELNLLRWLHTRAFPWIILRGEGRALAKTGHTNRKVREILATRYGYIRQAGRDTLLQDLKEDPFSRARVEVGRELLIEPDSIPVMLAPSQRRRASLPPQIVRLMQADAGPADETPPVLGRRRTRKPSPAS